MQTRSTITDTATTKARRSPEALLQGRLRDVFASSWWYFVLAVVVLLLAAGLRPDAFFAGDPGVKLIAARNVLAHPAHPLDLPLPSVAGASVPFVEPFFARHDGHSHAVTAELFPLLTAPLLALFGLRGVYVLPALGFLLAVFATARLGAALDPLRSSTWSAIVAALATPFLFYGLEFWEHMPAIALGAMGAVLLVENAAGPRLPASGSSPATQREVRSVKPGARAFLVAGMLFGLATLLRPEAGWFAAAVLIAARRLDPPPAWRTLAFVVLGAAVAAAPFEVYTFLHFGTIAPPHVATNAGLLNDTWVSARAALLRSWCGATDAAVWRATPAILVAFAAPAIGNRRGAAFLWTVAAVDVVLVLLTAPNDGGAQWGPRYLLFAYVPLAILAADVLARAGAAGEAKPARHAKGTGRTGLRLWAGLGAAVAFVAISAWTSRSSYRTLRGTKAEYGRLVDALAASVPSGAYVVTDVWWLDQVAAASAARVQFLYADNDREAATLMAAMQAASARFIRVTNSTSPRVHSWDDSGCRANADHEQLPVRDLVLTRGDCTR